MSLKLFTYPDNYRAWKALIAAQYNQVDIELPAFDMDKDCKSESFKAKNPLQKVPVLETPSGCIFESNAIARYVARLRNDANLMGASNFEQGQVDQWLEFCTNELEPARGIWLYPIMGYLAYNEKAYTEAKKEMVRAMTVLNNHLLHNTFLVGNAVTLADIVIASSLVHLYTMVFTPKFLAPFGNVTRWFTILVHQPEFSKVTGKIEFAKEEAVAPKAGKAKEAKAEKPKEAAKPKEEAKPVEDAPKPIKAKNPLDDLPPSSMDLDTIKKLCFSKRPILPDFFEKLWPQFDYEGYSWITCDYNYSEENTEFWKLGNLIGGFLQRSESCRKYAMGCMQLAGPDDEDGKGPWPLTGVWLMRGSQLMPEMMDNPDAEYYTWTKVDVTTDAGKAKVKEYFLGEHVNGLHVQDRRYFK